MATKKEIEGFIWLGIIGFPIFLLIVIIDTIGWIIPLIIIILSIAGFMWMKTNNRKKRYIYLKNKYYDEQLVKKIVEGYFWEGQTAEQLRDSIGIPAEIDEKILKTKKKEIWKYNRKSANRFALRITLDNDIVVGWDKKA